MSPTREIRRDILRSLLTNTGPTPIAEVRHHPITRHWTSAQFALGLGDLMLDEGGYVGFGPPAPREESA